MEGVVFYPYWNRYSGYVFAFSACDISAKSVDLQNVSPTVMGFHTALLPIKELTSQQEKYNNEPTIIE